MSLPAITEVDDPQEDLSDFRRYFVSLYEKLPTNEHRSCVAYFHIYALDLPQAIGDMTPLIGLYQFMELEEMTPDGPLKAAVLYADARLVPAKFDAPENTEDSLDAFEKKVA